MTQRSSTPFEFVDDITGFRAPSALIVRLSGRLRRKRDLLRALACGLKLPRYFGQNWDALEECLCDLSWLGEHFEVALIHKHMPLKNEVQRHVYLDILRHAQAEQHLPLRVIFPRRAQADVEKRGRLSPR